MFNAPPMKSLSRRQWVRLNDQSLCFSDFSFLLDNGVVKVCFIDGYDGWQGIVTAVSQRSFFCCHRSSLILVGNLEWWRCRLRLTGSSLSLWFSVDLLKQPRLVIHG